MKSSTVSSHLYLTSLCVSKALQPSFLAKLNLMVANWEDSVVLITQKMARRSEIRISSAFWIERKTFFMLQILMQKRDEIVEQSILINLWLCAKIVMQ